MSFENSSLGYPNEYAYPPGESVYNTGYGGAWHTHDGFDMEGLTLLTEQLEQYETLRRTLEYKGGNLFLIRKITRLLNEKIPIGGPGVMDEAALSEPERLRAALRKAGQTDIKFTVRRLTHGLPAYYVARTHRDWWGVYSLIVEDIHLSPGYPLLDPRFARIMTFGKERYHLRLSVFRPQVTALFKDAGTHCGRLSDTLLYDLGRCIFQGTWHTDQRFIFVFSDIFDLPALRHIIELVYLSLSCDLSMLRRFMRPSMRQFFAACYGNPGITRLLEKLDVMSGVEMSAMSQRALDVYQRISSAINEALSTPIKWTSSWQDSLPFWKIAVANVGRLDIVAKQLHDDAALGAALEQLRASAVRCMNYLLEEDHELRASA